MDVLVLDLVPVLYGEDLESVRVFEKPLERLARELDAQFGPDGLPKDRSPPFFRAHIEKLGNIRVADKLEGAVKLDRRQLLELGRTEW